MDYINLFREKQIESNPDYPCNDIGISKLFHDLHSNIICYVVEPKSWYVFTGKRWEKDEANLYVMELCKSFAQALSKYTELVDDGTEESVALIKYATALTGRKRREGLLYDSRSIAPKSLANFDRDKLLFNCRNGTYNLRTMMLQPHNPNDFITKISKVRYEKGAVCKRWERFIKEIMCDDMDMSRFLQKALGYALSGDTSLECFFILYGNTTRNGKSTLTETIAHIFGDYARTVQPHTLTRRSADGASPSPDMARLKGARLVNTSEPEKGMELNVALVKQLTGGDTYTARNLRENHIEFSPMFKIFVNTNHLPRTSDDTIFTSGRIKLIPFDRYFQPHEQDSNLKRLFRKPKSKSGILNWLIEGYKLLQAEGLPLPEKVNNAIQVYRHEGMVVWGMWLLGWYHLCHLYHHDVLAKRKYKSSSNCK